jgi:hypothetical protein
MRRLVGGLVLLAVACVDFDQLGRDARARSLDGGATGGGGGSGGGMTTEDAGAPDGGSGGGQGGMPDAGEDGGTIACLAGTEIEVGWVRNVTRNSGSKSARTIPGNLVATKERLALVVAEEELGILLAKSRLLLYDTAGRLIQKSGKPFEDAAGDPNTLGNNPDTFSAELGGLLLGADAENDSLAFATARLNAEGGNPMASVPRQPTITFVNATKATAASYNQMTPPLLGGLHFISGPLSGATPQIGIFRLDAAELTYGVMEESGDFKPNSPQVTCAGIPRQAAYSPQRRDRSVYALAKCGSNAVSYTFLDTEVPTLIRENAPVMLLGRALLGNGGPEPSRLPILGLISAKNELRFTTIEASSFGKGVDVGLIGKAPSKAELLAMTVTPKAVYVALAAPEGTDVSLGCLPTFQVTASELILASFNDAGQLRWAAPFPGKIKVRTNALAVAEGKLFMEATCPVQRVDDTDVLNLCDPGRTNSLLYLRRPGGGEL